MSALNDLHAQVNSIRERRDEEIAVISEYVSESINAMSELRSEVDDYLAEYEYMRVSQAVDEAVGIIESASGDDQLAELVELASLRLPGDRSPDPVGDGLEPLRRLTTADLPPVVVNEEIYNDDEQSGLRIETQRDRVNDCAQHLRYLFDVFESELWPRVLAAAQAGDRSTTESLVGRCPDLVAELRSTHDLWMLELNELYEETPGSLGQSGETTSAFGTWPPGSGSSQRHR